MKGADNPLISPFANLQLDNFLLDKFKTRDALLFKDYGVFFTNKVLLKILY